MFRVGFRSFYIAVLWVVAVALLSACGGGGGGSGGSNTGSIVVQADWDASATTALSLPGSDALHQPVSVITVRAMVSAADISSFTPQDFPATAGVATITGIPPGTMRTLTLQGLDGAGTAIFEAIIPGLTITAGATTDAGAVTLTLIGSPSIGLTVNPTSGLITTEAGGTATFTIVLNTPPTADVTVPVNTGDATEALVQEGSNVATLGGAITLTFTDVNWSIPQTVTVVGQNDVIDDGNQAITITTPVTTSADANYNGLNPLDVSVSNSDDDNAGITINPTIGLVTTEAGGTDTFTVVLDIPPADDVTIPVSSSDTSEALVQGGDSPATPVAAITLTFTTANWNTPQTVTLVGQDDIINDGSQVVTITTGAATSTDPGYNTLDAADVAASNSDNDNAGITVNPTSGLITTEAGGTDSFTVVLDTQPTVNVTIGVSSSDTSEALVQGGSSPGTPVASLTLTFTTANWNTPQTVTVAGQDDAADDGNQAITILTAAAGSADVNYSGINAADVTGSNTDNDNAGITVTPTVGLVTTEAGGTDTFTVVLDTQPTANVTIGVSSSDTTEILLQGGNSPATPATSITLTFTSVDWATPQTVTVLGQDDGILDGNLAVNAITAAAVSADGNYSTLNAADVSVTNNDNDGAGITVTPTGGLVTTEAGGTDSFTVVLNFPPTVNVTVGVSSGDTTEALVQGGDSPATPVAAITLTFTTADWATPQTVTVVGQDEAIVDGNQAITIVTAPAAGDAAYVGINASDVSVTNNDNDIAGITVTPTSGLVTTEAGATDTFTVVLNTTPVANVTIPVSTSDNTEALVQGGDSPATPVNSITLTFTMADWATPQTVTVVGQNDPTDDGNQAVTILTAAATSTDGNYDTLNAADVSVTNNDDDNAGITVNPTSGLTASEAGGTTTFTMVLDTQPTGNVVLTVTSTNTGEALVRGGDSPATPVTTINLTFTTLDWATPQTVTIVGQDELADDGNQLVTFTTLVDTINTLDTDYDPLNPADVTATINDDDNAGITVNPTSGLVTTESGGTDTFTVVLDTQPTANVTVDVASDTPADVRVQGGDSPATPANVITLTFTSADWSTAQTVTAVGQDDGATVDGNVAVTLTTAAAVSTDGNYSGIDPADVSVTNNDNDAAGITVNPTSGLSTTEVGGTDTFTVVLATTPTANVDIGVSSGDTGEILVQGGDSPATPVAAITLTFTMADWSTPQTVTLVGQDDAGAMDGNQAVLITTAAAVSGDGNYNTLNAADVNATNVDDDLPMAPSPPVVTTPAATPSFTSSTPATISGTKEANSSIWIDGALAVAEDALTTWSVSQGLSGGLNSFSITSKNNGDTLESSPAVIIDITLDIANPNPPVISALDGGAVSSPITTGNNDLLIQGGPAVGGAGTDCEPNATVQAFESAVLRGSTTCDGSGNYTLTVSKFANGTFTFDISQTDQAGNPSTSVQQIWTRSVTPPGPPTITLPAASPHFTNTAPITLSGGCDSSSAHTVNLAGAQAGTVACGAAGGFPANTYSFSLINPGSDGTFTYLVSQTEDLTNAESTAVALDWVFDTVAPAIVVLSSPAANPVTTSSNSIIIAGSCEIGATVDLSGVNSVPATIDTQQDASCAGTFSFTTAAQVTDDTYTFTITQTDRAGNASGAVTVTMIRDSTVPATPGLVQPATNTVYLNSIMPADTLTIEVSCTDDGNHTVTLDDGVAVPPLEEACAGATHTFVVANPGAENTSNFTIFQTNNGLTPPVDSASVAVTWIIDTTAPADPTIIAPSVDPFTSPDPLVVTGNCEVDARVDIDPFVPSTFTDNQVCAADGTYTFTVTEGAPADDTKDNTYTYDVYQTDLATNVSAGQGVADITWIRDTFAVTPPVITSPAANPFISNTADLALLGTCTAGNDVNLSGADTQTTPCVAGGFSFLVTGLADGTHVFSLTQTFSATVSSPISFTWVKDTTLPDLTITFAPVEPSNPTKDVVFEFTSTDPLATFECKLDAGSFAACLSPIVFTGLTGAHTAEVRARDTAGNISPPDPAQPFSWTQAFNDTVVLYHMDVGAPLDDASLYAAPNDSTLTTDLGTASATGKFAEGRDFVKADPDFMSVADNDAHRAFRTQMTVEAWVKFDAPGLTNKGKAVIVSKFDSATALEWKFGIFRRGGGGGEGSILLFFEAGVDGLAPGREAVSAKIFTGATIYPTPFHHVAVTWNRGTVTFFFDGALLSTRVLGVAGTSIINKDTATPPDLVLGAEEAGTANFINGIIDEVRISQTVRYLATFSVPIVAFTAD